MSLVAIRMWLRAIFLRARVEREMEKEMRLHLELEAEQNIRAGMSPAEARRQARLAFGGVERAREEMRDARLTRWLEQIVQDVRFALRGCRRSPGFALSVTVLLGLGIGANAALFTVMYNLLIAPLPYADGDRMARVFATANGGQFLWTLPRGVVDEWATTTRAGSDVIPLHLERYVLGDTSRENAERLDGAEVPPGATAFVGMRPILGRDILPADTMAGAAPVVLLSHRVWQARFGAADSVLGRYLRLDGRDYRIVGVLPPEFEVPFFKGAYDDVFPALRSGPNVDIEAIAKLRAGASVEQANRELAAIFRNHQLVAPVGSGPQPDVPTLRRAVDLVRPAVRNMVVVLLGGTALVLLIAAANVANLLLARSWSRKREIGVRTALGASRGRVFQQAFVEHALLASSGGMLAIGIGMAALRLVTALQPEGVDLALGHEGTARVLLLAIGAISAVSALTFGLGPAIAASGVPMLDALRTGGRTASGSVLGRRFRASLVIGEVALSVVLLAGTGLLVRSLIGMQRADIGMDPRGLYGVSVQFPAARFPNPEDRRVALASIMSAARAVPGLTAVTAGITMPPEFGAALSGFFIEGRELNLPDSMRALAFNSVTPDFFTTSGTRVVRGRPFAPNEQVTNLVGSNEAMVNESFARRFFPDGDALGRRIRTGKTPWAEIVGVVADVRTPGAMSAWEALQIYQAMPAAPTRVQIIARSPMRKDEAIGTLTAAIHNAAPLAVIGRASSAEEYLVAERQAPRFMLKLIGIFAGLALLLAGVGLHAVISYSVGQRMREFGVRIALGAEPATLMRFVHRQGLTLVLTGVLIGAIAAIGATRLLRALLYGVGPGDPITMVGVIGVLVVVAVMATYLPARRAMRVSPVEVLREE